MIFPQVNKGMNEARGNIGPGQNNGRLIDVFRHIDHRDKNIEQNWHRHEVVVVVAHFEHGVGHVLFIAVNFENAVIDLAGSGRLDPHNAHNRRKDERPKDERQDGKENMVWILCHDLPLFLIYKNFDSI